MDTIKLIASVGSNFDRSKERFEMILEPLQAMIQLALLSYCPIGTKLSISENILIIQPPGWGQGLKRKYNSDKKNDLALLKASFKPSSTLRLSKNGPELMQDIFVAGYPFGKDLGSSLKVTKGIISSLAGINNNNAEIQIAVGLTSLLL